MIVLKYRSVQLRMQPFASFGTRTPQTPVCSLGQQSAMFVRSLGHGAQSACVPYGMAGF